MIPQDFITEWRAHAPWVSDFQVEQDLVISRALVMLFENPVIAEALAFATVLSSKCLNIGDPRRYLHSVSEPA